MADLHLQRLRSDFEVRFKGMDMSDYDGKPAEARDVAFLSRALAAFAVVQLEGATDSEAVDSVVDGFEDNGIDAIYFNRAESTLLVCQSKWKSSGRGSVSQGDLAKFLNGVNHIVLLDFEKLGPALQARKQTIREAINNPDVRIKLVLTYSGEDRLGEVVQRDIEDFLAKNNTPVELFLCNVLDQGANYTALGELRSGAPISLDVRLVEWGCMKEPFEAFYGRVSAREIASWWAAHGWKLLTKNIRSFKGSTDVNSGIEETIQTHAEHFWYFNNGITLLCESIKKKPLGGAQREYGEFECEGASVVNGAQTVGQIGSAFDHPDRAPEDAQVLVRIISLENVPEGFGQRITRATNTQNRVEGRDFASLDENQRRIHRELALDGVEYAYRSGDEIDDPSSGFSLTEATVALACAQGDVALAVMVKNQIGKFFENIKSAPYSDLFNDRTKPTEVWRAVRLMRVADGEIQRLASSDLSKAELLAAHANRLVLHLVFRDPELADWRDPKKTIDELEAVARKAARTAFAEVANDFDQNEQAYPQPFFKTLDRCRQLTARVISARESSSPDEEGGEDDPSTGGRGMLPFR